MARRIGFGVVGLGRIGRIHAEILRARVERARLVAVADVVGEVSRRYGEILGVRWYTEYQDLLRDAEVEAVIISTPTFLHKDMIIEALEHGKSVFVEKPMTVTSEEAKEVVSRVRSAGLRLQVGYMRRFDYAYRKAKRALEKGDIGNPIYFLSIARDPGPPPKWAAEREKGGGIFLDMLSHDFDMARWLMSSEINEVYVHAGNYLHEELKGLGDPDVVSVSFRMERGMMGYIHGARKSVFGYELRTEVYGSEGLVSVGDKIDNMYSQGTREGVTYGGISWFEKRFYEAYVSELDSFAQSLIEDKPTLVNELDGYIVARIAEACWESYERDKPVRIDYDI